MELCLEHWDILEDGELGKELLQGIVEQIVQRYARQRKLTYTEAACIAYALLEVLTAGHEFVKIWTDIARLQFGIRQLQTVKAKTFLSSTSVLMELTA